MDFIKIENLTKIYGQGEAAVVALDHVNINLGQGEFVAVMGPSGCGKSTLLHLTGGLDRPSEGTVSLDGQDIFHMDDTHLTELRRRRIGFIFQFFNLLPMLTAEENAAIPLILDGMPVEKANKRAAEILEKVGLGDRLTHRPDQLSGGQQQRVAIARALVTDPAIILADEPTGNLDSRSSDEFAALLRQVSSEWKRTILMVTHDPRIAAYADRIIFLKDGKVVEETTLNGNAKDEAGRLKKRVEAL
jgi:putative ABC transport system ATP-binding protein